MSAADDEYDEYDEYDDDDDEYDKYDGDESRLSNIGMAIAFLNDPERQSALAHLRK